MNTIASSGQNFNLESNLEWNTSLENEIKKLLPLELFLDEKEDILPKLRSFFRKHQIVDHTKQRIIMQTIANTYSQIRRLPNDYEIFVSISSSINKAQEISSKGEFIQEKSQEAVNQMRTRISTIVLSRAL